MIVSTIKWVQLIIGAFTNQFWGLIGELKYMTQTAVLTCPMGPRKDL